MKLSEEQERKLELAQQIIGYKFKEVSFLLSAITHPSAVEGYERTATVTSAYKERTRLRTG